MKEIYFITSNKGKVKEASEKFIEIGIKVIQKNLGYPEIQTDSLEEVTKYGVNILKNKINHSFILEDAGLFIDSLKGFPGVYSSFIYYTLGLDGILNLLKGTNEIDRTATFKSVFAYSKPGEELQLFTGECKGKISFTKKGDNGFGYDPIFIPGKSDKTFAEMSTSEKNSFSHRGKSLEKLFESLKNEGL
jgi:XTP/dITP diphosphohydrolase